MTRASPVKHRVHSHRRGDAKVHEYERGHGKHPKTVVRRVPARPLGGSYLVTVEYASGKSSSVVEAASYGGALNQGIEGATDTPRAVTMRRR